MEDCLANRLEGGGVNIVHVVGDGVPVRIESRFLLRMILYDIDSRNAASYQLHMVVGHSTTEFILK